MTPLRQQMIRVMQLRNLSAHTQAAYLSAFTGLARYYHASPETMSKDMLEDYLLYLKNTRAAAPNSRGMVVCAMRFLYHHVLDWQERCPEFAFGRKPRKLPTILTPPQAWNLIHAADNLKHRLMLMAAYSAGLRASEVLALRPEHIDRQQMLIKVVAGKGQKDRYTILSHRFLATRASWPSRETSARASSRMWRMRCGALDRTWPVSRPRKAPGGSSEPAASHRYKKPGSATEPGFL